MRVVDERGERQVLIALAHQRLQPLPESVALGLGTSRDAADREVVRDHSAAVGDVDETDAPFRERRERSSRKALFPCARLHLRAARRARPACDYRECLLRLRWHTWVERSVPRRKEDAE